MNVIFLVNGTGKRFKDEGYDIPKPLINVEGEPMLVKVIKSFEFNSQDNVYISYHRSLIKYNFEYIIKKHFPHIVFNFYCLPYDTNGAANTLIQTLDYFNINEDFLIADCDVLYTESPIKHFKNLNYSAIGISKNYLPTPYFSYVRLNDNSIVEIKEKEKISDDICCGLYFFTKNDKNKLKKIIEELNQSLSTEIYISYIYDKLLHQKEIIRPIYIESPIVIGTPFQLQLYSSSNLSSLNNKRFCFDLDNTLVSYPEGKDYSTVEPLHQNIEYLKKLKENGAYIIIYTARRMRTHNGDVSKVIADIGEITIQTLKKFNIPYDELHFGKPYAHFYIDDLAIDANTDLSKHIGYYFNTIESRSKHSITYNNEICVKEGNLEGESFFYKNAPDELKNKYFPKFFSIEDKKIEMEKINGIPLSHLYTRGDLNEIILNKVFESLNNFHSYKQIDFNLDPNANYKEKIISRYEEIVSIDQSAKTILDNILEKLKSYDCSNVCLIHGDPVFSNIFYTENGNLKFIDVRGKLNETYSLYGDEMYDWAKLYQSIMGYDFILLNKHLDFEIIEKWKSLFEQKFIEQFNKEKLNQLKILTESLLVTCIPFHPKSKSSSFLNLIKTFLA